MDPTPGFRPTGTTAPPLVLETAAALWRFYNQFGADVGILDAPTLDHAMYSSYGDSVTRRNAAEQVLVTYYGQLFGWDARQLVLNFIQLAPRNSAGRAAIKSRLDSLVGACVTTGSVKHIETS